MKNYETSDYESIKKLFLNNEGRWFSGNLLKDRYKISTILLQKMIHDMRVNGIFIISGGLKGYKYTLDKEEILKTYLSLKKRAESINMSAKGMYDAMLEHELVTNNGCTGYCHNI